MARTYGLACAECKRYVWVAQKGVTDKVTVYGTDEVRDLLAVFLFEHIGHLMLFEDTERLCVDDYEEVSDEAP